VRHDNRTRDFELLALPHLDAVYNVAAWLAGDAADAEDLVQEVYLRAFRYFEGYQGGDFRAWLLTIVRNTFITWMNTRRTDRLMFHGDALVGNTEDTKETAWGTPPRNPEALLMERFASETLQRLMDRMPMEYREVLLLREIEDLSYKQNAEVTGLPIGTAMSRLSRARLALQKLWLRTTQSENDNRLRPHPPPVAADRQSRALHIESTGASEFARVGASPPAPREYNRSGTSTIEGASGFAQTAG
jgi:RNA polymerase sigma factor (sigma-70 family)